MFVPLAPLLSTKLFDILTMLEADKMNNMFNFGFLFKSCNQAKNKC